MTLAVRRGVHPRDSFDVWAGRGGREEEHGGWPVVVFQDDMGHSPGREEVRGYCPSGKDNQATFILSDSEFDPGLAGLRVISVQRLRGNVQCWIVVALSIKTEVKAVDAVLGLVQEGEELVVPRKGAEESQRRLQAFEESVELMRLVAALPEIGRRTSQQLSHRYSLQPNAWAYPGRIRRFSG